MKNTLQKCAKTLAVTFGACLFFERYSDTESQFVMASIGAQSQEKPQIICSRQYFDLSLWRTKAAKSCCCATEGTGTLIWPRFFRLIRFRVLPVTKASTWDWHKCVNVYATKNSGRSLSERRIMVQSTAVMHFPSPSGMIQALPTGSGSLETSMSKGFTSVQFKRLKVSSLIKRARSPLSI